MPTGIPSEFRRNFRRTPSDKSVDLNALSGRGVLNLGEGVDLRENEFLEREGVREREGEGRERK